jgi:hypothetical protein
MSDSQPKQGKQVSGLLEAGNINLLKRPQVKNPDGSISTVRSISIEQDGKTFLIPTVSDDGRVVTDQEAVDIFHSTGKHLGVFDNEDNATKYAQELHKQQENYYLGPEGLNNKNQKEALQFDSHFSGAFDAAETHEAIEFAKQFDQQPTGGASSEKPTDAATEDSFAQEGAAALSAGRDIGLGTIQAPREIARGVTKGINSMLGFMEAVKDFVPTVSILDDEGNLSGPSITTIGKDEERLQVGVDKKFKERGEAPPNVKDGVQLPVPDAPAVPTVTGSLIEGISQFATGLKGVDKIGGLFKGVKALEGVAEGADVGSEIGQILNNIGKGAGADLLAFDQHEQRLSNVIEQVPELKNPVTEFLQAKPDDSFVEGKLKQAIEGLGLSAVGETLFQGIKVLKKGLTAKGELEAAGGKIDDLLDLPAEEKAGLDLPVNEFHFLGDPAGERLQPKTKIEIAEEEVQGAFGKTKQVSDKPNVPIDDFEINFSRIDAPDDIKQLMDEMLNKPELKASIDAERRGARTNAQTLSAAQDIDGYESLLARRTGDAFNAEQIVAGRKVYYDTTTKLMDAARKAAAPTATDIDHFNFRKMIAVHQAVQKEFMGIRAEAGRALQAWRIPVGGTGGENVRALEQVLNEFGGADASKELARRLATINDHMNTSQINAIVNKTALARTTDAVTEAWTLGLLTNPTTHVVNLSSNVLTALQLGMERFAMAGVKDSPVTFREGLEFFSGMMESQKLAIKNMAQAFRTGETGIGLGKIDLPRTRSTARDILDPDGKAGIFSKALDGYGAILNKFVGGGLAAGDEYSKTILYQAQLRSLAIRDGIAQGLEGEALTKHIADVLADPPPGVKADAATFATYGTFTRELGKAGQAAQKIISQYPALRFVAPFVRTPGNIFKFAFERTPLAPLSKKVRDDITAGGVRKASALAKIGMGTSMMALAADMSLNGKMTGSGPNDPKIRAGLKRTGWQPYSIKFGDTWYSYARFEPVATLFGMSADISEILSNYEAYDVQAQEEADELVTAAVLAIGNQVVGKTFLQGFADIAEVLSDPKRNGEAFLERFAGSFVPAGSAAIERAIDPAAELVFNKIDAIRSRIPGLSSAVPPRRNIWGEEIKYFYPNDEDLLASTAERIGSLFNPVYTSTEKKDAVVDRWMLQNGFNIDMPDKTQSFEGVRIDLRKYPQIYDRLVVLRGNEAKLTRYSNQGMQEFFRNLVTEEDPFGRHIGFFTSIGKDFDDQQNFISQVVRDYQDAAKDQLLDEFPELSDVIKREQRNAAALNAVRPAASKEEKP